MFVAGVLCLVFNCVRFSEVALWCFVGVFYVVTFRFCVFLLVYEFVDIDFSFVCV